MKLDRKPLTRRKLLLKSTKHAIWLLFSLWTGFSFVGFFTPITDLGAGLLDLSVGPWEAFWIVFYGFATYGNAGWMREQVCIYMCPYARFQGVMFDRDTLVIAYDEARGEPRGSRARSADHKAAGLGECIDCTLCVQVCPTGIDIRDGLQYQCIACAACIDVCDSVMDKMGYPRGLVRYTTENAVTSGQRRLLRPRMIVYAALLLVLTAALGVSVVMRTPLVLDVIRDRNALYRETGDGSIENVYTLRLVNMDDAAHMFRISLAGPPGMQLAPGNEAVRAAAGEVVSVSARLRTDPQTLERRSTEVVFSASALEDPRLRVEQEARFLGPQRDP